jgi:TolB-like protein/DNA-binding winged helix-turn-helix (wHTH) protein/Tfp pilus assembly protein PilF
MDTPAEDPSYRKERYLVGDLHIDVDQRLVMRDGKRISLPRLSFDLLLELVRAGPNFVSSETLLATVWIRKIVGPETVTQRVKLVRDALGDDSHHPRYVDVVWGQGYRVCAEVTRLHDDEASSGIEGAERGWRLLIGSGMAVTAMATLLLFIFSEQIFLPANTKAKDGFAPPTASIAVLPFINVGNATENEYFSVGLPDSLLNKLANLEDVVVISRTSSFSFHNKNVDSKTIGRSLNVRYLLEGSVQRSDNDVRIIAQLVNTLDASHVWSFERRFRMKDIFAVQDELVLEITRALEVTLRNTENERLLAHGTKNVPAFLAFLRGKYASDSASLELQDEALRRYQEAIELDPNFARAWLGMAGVYQTLGLHGALDQQVSKDQVASSIERALELDENLGQAYAMRAMMISVDDMTETDIDLAEIRRTLLEKAVSLSPNDPFVLSSYAAALCPRMLKEPACHEKKVAVLNEAIRRDPENPEPYIELGWTHVALNRAQMPGRYFMESVRRNPDYIPGYGTIALWHWGSKNIDWMHSIACLCEAIDRDPTNSYMHSMLSSIYIDLGMEATAQNFIDSADDNSESHRDSKTYNRMKLHLYRNEISAAADIARNDLRKVAGGSLSIIAYGAIVEDALARADFQPAIDVLEAAFKDYNVAVEYKDGLIRARSAALAAVSLSELHRSAGNVNRADELINGASEYFERENVGNSVWRASNAWAYAIVLLRQGNIQRSLDELKLVPQSYMRNSWFVSRFSAFESIRQMDEFKEIVAAIDSRIAEQRSEVSRHMGNPPPCVPENQAVLSALVF